MKKLCMIVIILLCTSLATSVCAFENKGATLENQDFKSYKYKITPEGGDPSENVVLRSIDGSCTSYICKFGCEVTLVETGQTVTVGPEDKVIIYRGVLKIK